MRRQLTDWTSHRGTLIAAIALLLLLAAGPAAAEKRVALVVGNSAYQNIARLDNPRNDATLMADTLSSLGFTLIGGRARLDLDKAALDIDVQNFGRQIQGADVALFYYAGHGVQVNGANYLVPVGANPTREADVDFQMVDVNLVLRQMQGSGTRLNMVILDACRNNPFGARGSRSADGGLAQMRAPEGTMISYATQPGSVAHGRQRRPQPLYQGPGDDHQTAGARHLPDLQPGRPRGEAGDRRIAAALGVVLADRWRLLFRRAAASCRTSSRSTSGRDRAAAPPQPADPLRPDPDFVPIKDAALLRELNERLYEHNFDPDVPDSKAGFKLAISKFQQKSNLPQSGEATEGVLARLRKLDDLKPWGSIVYGPDSNDVGHFLESRLAQGGRGRRALEMW